MGEQKIMDKKEEIFCKELKNLSPDVCQECGTKHDPRKPHNKESLYYQCYFYEKYGRPPTWSDAMEHCDDATREMWRAALKKYKITII